MTGSKQIRSFFSAVFLAEHAPAGATGHAAAGTSSETGAAAKEISPAAITSSTLDDLDKSIAAATESIAISAQSTEHSAMPSRKKTLLDLASEIMSGTDDTNERQQSDDTSVRSLVLERVCMTCTHLFNVVLFVEPIVANSSERYC